MRIGEVGSWMPQAGVIAGLASAVVCVWAYTSLADAPSAIGAAGLLYCGLLAALALTVVSLLAWFVRGLAGRAGRGS